VRRWLGGGLPGLEQLNAAAAQAGLRVASGAPLRFVAPQVDEENYELRTFRSGCVASRPGNLHDVFNGLAWLAFPKTKARINAMHAAEIPREGGTRGRLRDMLTIFDEGGAIVACDEGIAELVREARWRELFLERSREFSITVVGHAVLEQALAPHPGITCKVIFADPSRDLDAQAARWLANDGKTPKDMPPLPVFGYPGWFARSGEAGFYDDQRYFRPARTRSSNSRFAQG